MIKPYYQDEHATIYHGDMTQIMPELQYDLIVTDPPYGIEAVENSNMTNRANHKPITGDTDTNAANSLFAQLPAHTPAAIFGANYFPHLLPHRGRWVCWDKRLTVEADQMFGSPFELAWLNDRERHQTEMIRTLHSGNFNANGYGLARTHPTEKAIPMLKKLLAFMDAPGVILDPFAGSGTTLRAAKDLNRNSIGIEIDEKYCEIAANRLAQEVLDFG